MPVKIAKFDGGSDRLRSGRKLVGRADVRSVCNAIRLKIVRPMTLNPVRYWAELAHPATSCDWPATPLCALRRNRGRLT